MKALAPVYSCSKQCWVKGRKTVVDNTDKFEEVGTPYIWRVTLVPLVCVRGLKGGKTISASVSLKMCARC